MLFSQRPIETIKFEIQKAMKKLTLTQLKDMVTESKGSDAPESIYQFTFALNELEQRMHPMDYAEFEETI